jgi:hypothetical protein
VKTTKVAAATGVLLLVAGSAHAITVSGLNPNSSSYMVTASASGGDYSGVVELAIVRSDLGAGVIEECSGALLADGLSILTAADCVADHNSVEQATTAYVTFNLPDGTSTTSVVGFHVDPLYNGAAESPNDIAILTLAAPAPFAAARYNLYEGDGLGETFTLAGYGLGGTGATGYNGRLYPYGTLRVGENQYEAASGDGDYLFDFDDGLAAQDALGDGLGLGSDEAFIAPGDAGGPSFIDGEIAGVHSFVARILPDGSTADIDSVLDSSFGEYAGDASVQNNSAFIEEAMIGSTPEPKTMFLVGIALVVLSLMGSKRRQH